MLSLLTDLEFPGAPAPDLQRQPAGFDLTCAQIARFTGTGAIDLTNSRRELPALSPLAWPPASAAAESVSLVLDPAGYLVTYNEEIAVPVDCAGIVLPRSSLMRCGATLHSALWDPGYRGRGQGLLTVFSSLRLYRDARIGQFILLRLEAQADRTYDGQYQGENLDR
ncbi:deoxyuridine 5'-triphosphate nucleotidohydrolase [bacterium]|nr:deoxyuridine 5'-triphosphate nucleotidohydrolase [bacterium]